MIKILLNKGYSTNPNKRGLWTNLLEIDCEMEIEEEPYILIYFGRVIKKPTRILQKIKIDLSKERIIYSYTSNMWKNPLKVISKKNLIAMLKSLPIIRGKNLAEWGDYD